MDSMNDICGTCEYHWKNERGDFVCTNERNRGEEYGIETPYDHRCSNYELRSGYGEW